MGPPATPQPFAASDFKMPSAPASAFGLADKSSHPIIHERAVNFGTARAAGDDTASGVARASDRPHSEHICDNNKNGRYSYTDYDKNGPGDMALPRRSGDIDQRFSFLTPRTSAAHECMRPSRSAAEDSMTPPSRQQADSTYAHETSRSSYEQQQVAMRSASSLCPTEADALVSPRLTSGAAVPPSSSSMDVRPESLTGPVTPRSHRKDLLAGFPRWSWRDTNLHVAPPQIAESFCPIQPMVI